MSAGILEAAIAGLIGLAIGAGGIFFQQRNRRTDRTETRISRDATAHVADSKNALDAWISISAANAAEIASLHTRVDRMQKKVDEYEEVIVPALEKTIAEQRITIADQEATIADLMQQTAIQRSKIVALEARIGKLETELEHKETA